MPLNAPFKKIIKDFKLSAQLIKMKVGKITLLTGWLVYGNLALFPNQGNCAIDPNQNISRNKDLNQEFLRKALSIRENTLGTIDITGYLKQRALNYPIGHSPNEAGQNGHKSPQDQNLTQYWKTDGIYPWRKRIMTTTFWIGEDAAKNNPVPNDKSSWDTKWETNFGGYDTPDRSQRIGFRPAGFIPRQNPFYIALPYNDINMQGTKKEARHVIPWFEREFKRCGKSVIKGRWLAIHYKGRVCFAQWEDVGPFRTDHHQYVFGNQRPSPNRNKAAGLDVSPAVRDYLGLKGNDFTDWKFVEIHEVPRGPWTKYGENNPFSPHYTEKKLREQLSQQQNFADSKPTQYQNAIIR
jgi:hypothetical protein